MADTTTAFAGILIRTGASDSKAFVGLVNTALAKIDSKPVGHNLLTAITGEIAKQKFGYLVCIKPKASVKHSLGPLIHWRTYEKGAVTRAASDQASSDGTGAVSLILWDPKNEDTPDGSRPPFIALAHELIHCMYNLLGTSHLISANGNTSEQEKVIDEMRVTGLRGYENLAISENRIRKEHNIAYRSSYIGKCSKADGKPDKAAFI